MLAPAASLLVTRAVLESAALRLNDRRSERLRGGRSNSAPRTVRPQQSGLEHDSGRPTSGRRYLRRLLEGLRTGSSRLTNTREGPCGRASMAQGLAHRLTSTVGGEPRSTTCAGNRQEAGRAGVSGHPHHEGLPAPGRCRIPSLHSRRRAASSRAATMPLSARSPVRAAFRPAGASRHMRRWGEKGAACGA